MKQTLMEQWSLIQNQPLLKTVYLKPPIISYKSGKSLKDTLVSLKILTVRLSCEATAKTKLGVRAGLSLTNTLVSHFAPCPSQKLSVQQQCVVEGCVSKAKLISCGVPQGSILGPLLFLMYINDLPGCLLHTIHMYADDTTIHASSVSTAELYAKVNNVSTRVRDWLLANNFSLNVTKTEYIFLTTTFKLSNLGRDFPIKIGNNHVKRVQTTKNI